MSAKLRIGAFCLTPLKICSWRNSSRLVYSQLSLAELLKHLYFLSCPINLYLVP